MTASRPRSPWRGSRPASSGSRACTPTWRAATSSPTPWPVARTPGVEGGVILLTVNPTTLGTVTAGYLAAESITLEEGHVFGGPAAVSAAVRGRGHRRREQQRRAPGPVQAVGVPQREAAPVRHCRAGAVAWAARTIGVHDRGTPGGRSDRGSGHVCQHDRWTGALTVDDAACVRRRARRPASVNVLEVGRWAGPGPGPVNASTIMDRRRLRPTRGAAVGRRLELLVPRRTGARLLGEAEAR